MTERGEVRAVAWMPMGSELTADVAVGALQLTVDNPVDFDEDGGSVDLNGVQYDYDTIDPDSGILTLSWQLTVAAVAGDRVNVWSGGQVAIEYVAFVSLGDGDEVEVPIPYGDRDVWPEGQYDNPIVVNLSDDLESMTGVPTQTPIRDGSFINPATLPTPPKTDGLVPASSPTPTVVGGIGALFIKWVPPVNADPLTYDLHISPTQGFAPDATTLQVSTPQTQVTIRALTTGVGDPPDTSLKYGQTYYVRVLARDADGPAPAFGGEGSGQMMQVTGPDVAAETITGDQIVGGTITGDLLSSSVILGSTISTGALDDSGNIVGARVELGPDGLTNYAADGHVVVAFPTDPTDDAYVEAHMHMLSATVDDHFTMNGVNNAVAASASILLASGIQAPSSPPTLSATYDTVQLDCTTKVPSNGTAGGDYNLGTFNLDPAGITSMCWDQVYGCWQVFQQKSNGFRLWRFNVDGSLKLNVFGTAVWVDDFKNQQQATGCRGGWIQKWTDGSWYVWDTVIGGGRWGKVPSSWIIDGSPSDPFCAFDETGPTLMIVQNNTNAVDTMQVRRVHTVPYSGGSIQNLVNDSTTNSPVGVQRTGAITGCYYGPADFGGNRYVTGSGKYLTQAVWTPGTRYNTNGAYAEWPTNGIAMGFAYDGTNFWSVDANGMLSKYTGWTWTAEPTTSYVGMSAYDSDTTGGTHETPVGTLATRNVPRRSKLTITVPTTQDAGGPDDPDQWRVYFGRTTGPTPTAAQMKMVTALGSITVPLSTTISADPTGIAPPGGIFGQPGAINTFPAGNPAKITDGAGNTMIDAQGHGSVGIVGEVRMFAGATPPVGWLLCQGQAVSRTTYASLFATIGVLFGAGDGSTSFNLPDMRSRLPMGAGAITSLGQSEAGTPPANASTTPPTEDTGRAARWSHVHSHSAVNVNITQTGSAHTHNLPAAQATNTTTGGSANRLTGGGDTGTSGSGHNHGVTGTTESTTALGGTTTQGVPSVHASQAFNYIIRT